jgi:uncharacterized lipoprotein NlpE involved in copper resistance
MIRKMTVCLSVIGLILAGCVNQGAQLTEQEKKYAADTSLCNAATMQIDGEPQAFAQCMALHGWPLPPPPPRLTR